MRTAVVLGLVACAGMVLVAGGAMPDRNEGPVQRMGPLPSMAANSDMLALSAVVGDRLQQVTVIDPKQHVMSVYHVELATGKISLCSVRNFQWDMKLTEFNGDRPLPREIQSFLETK